MVEWLRDVGMPAEYINKLARMFQDIKVSEDLNRRFKDHHKESAMAGKGRGKRGGGREGGEGEERGGREGRGELECGTQCCFVRVGNPLTVKQH